MSPGLALVDRNWRKQHEDKGERRKTEHGMFGSSLKAFLTTGHTPEGAVERKAGTTMQLLSYTVKQCFPNFTHSLLPPQFHVVPLEPGTYDIFFIYINTKETLLK